MVLYASKCYVFVQFIPSDMHTVVLCFVLQWLRYEFLMD